MTMSARERARQVSARTHRRHVIRDSRAEVERVATADVASRCCGPTHAGADHAPASATAGFADGACANWLCPWHALAAVLQLACQDGTAARHVTRTMRRLSGPLYGRAFARVLVSVGLKGLR